MLDILDVKGNLEKKKVEKSHTLFNFNLGFITNPKNGRVKALSKACLDRTYINKKCRCLDVYHPQIIIILYLSVIFRSTLVFFLYFLRKITFSMCID